jgi:hypothetical protein
MCQPLYREFLPGVCQLPPHDHHQSEAKQEKQQCRDAVLNPDHFVVDGKNVRSPEPLRMMRCMGSVTRLSVGVFQEA